MCELRSLVHSAPEVNCSGEQESFNLFLPPIEQEHKRKRLESFFELKKNIWRRKKLIFPTQPGIPDYFTDSNPSLLISKPSLSTLAARLAYQQNKHYFRTQRRAKQVIAAAKPSKP